MTVVSVHFKKESAICLHFEEVISENEYLFQARTSGAQIRSVFAYFFKKNCHLAETDVFENSVFKNSCLFTFFS